MFLTGPQIDAFVRALARAFPNPPRFDQFLLARFDKARVEISLAEDYISILYDVVRTANAEGWAIALLVKARASVPANPQLVAFETSLALGAVPADEQRSLEKIVNERSRFTDVMQFQERFGRLVLWLCAIESPVGGGTGVLVGPDVVMTNFHVVEPIVKGQVSAADVRCRFDYRANANGAAIDGGIAVPIAAQWEIAKSPYSQADRVANGSGWLTSELDFALVRLQSSVGNDPVGEKAERDAAKREWLTLSSTPPAVAAGDVMFILQHPQDLGAHPARLQPMKLATGRVLGFVGDGLRIRHDTRTLPGSSGSPCFNADLEFVALHHAGEPNSRLDYKGSYNQAIPLKEIARYLSASDAKVVLDVAPPSR